MYFKKLLISLLLIEVSMLKQGHNNPTAIQNTIHSLKNNGNDLISLPQYKKLLSKPKEVKKEIDRISNFHKQFDQKSFGKNNDLDKIAPLLIKVYNIIKQSHKMTKKQNCKSLNGIRKNDHFKSRNIIMPRNINTVFSSYKEAQKDVKRINYYRKQFGEKPLREAKDLNDVAQYQAEHYQDTLKDPKTGNLWADDDAEKLGRPKLSSYYASGENIVSDATMAMQNKETKDNILSPHFNQVGTGFWAGMMIEEFAS